MPQTDQAKRKPHHDIVEGEIVAEFSDETLMNLPHVPGTQDETPAVPAVMSQPVDAGRRQFVLRLLVGGAAALALGGGAALLLTQRREPTVVILPNGTQVAVTGPVDVAALLQQVTQLQNDLAAAAADRDRYMNDLSLANDELARLRAELQAAQTLNDLWQALDDVGLDVMLGGAIQSLNLALGAMLGVTSLLQTGAVDAQNALDSFVANLPGPEAGMAWLQSQVTTLAKSLDRLAEQVQQAIEPVEPYAQLIANFVKWVLDHLSLLIGSKARAGMEGMQGIVNNLPDLVSGINTGVLVPLADWFGHDGARSLLGILVDPVKNRLLGPALDVLSEFSDFQTSYQTDLVTPVQAALAQRSTIRQQIAQLTPGATPTPTP